MTPTILDGRYELLELLGEGGMGQVFKARHTRLGKIFAIKSLRNLSPDPNEQAKFLEAFETEARTLAELSHPALAQVSDFFEADDVHYLVMDFVNGKTLTRVAELAPRLLSQRRVLAWAQELCDVLHYLHTQEPPVIVRDLKPDNVMLDDQRRLRLLDFGIAKRLQAGVGTRDIIKGMGTAEYAPLEQYGSASTDQRSDIYALGGTLYFLLTEIAPPPAWRRASEGVALELPSAHNETVTPDFERLVLKMMALKREDRPQSVAEISGELEIIGKAPGAKVAAPPNPPKAWIPTPPAYIPEPAASGAYTPPASSHRYGMPGAAVPEPRTDIKAPVTPPSSTGRIPSVSVLEVRNLRRYATPPQAVRFCPGQPLVAVAGRYLHVWHATTCQIASKLWTGEQELTSLDFSSDGRTLVVAESGGEIHQYDLMQGKHTAQLSRRNWGLFADRVRDVSMLAASSLLAVASDASNIRIFDTRGGKQVRQLEWHQTGIFSKLGKKTLSLAGSRHGLLAAGGADGSLTLYQGPDMKVRHRVFLDSGEITSLEFSLDGAFLAAAASRGKVLLIQVPDLKVVNELKHPATPLSVAISSDLRVVATGASDCHIRLFHLNTGKELHRLTHHAGAVLDVDFSDLGPTLVSVGNDRRLFVTDFSW